MHESHRRREALKSKQISEVLSLEEAHVQEYRQLEHLWDQRMVEYDGKAQELEHAMIVRHHAGLEDLRRSNADLKPKVKFSKELLNLRKIQATLARQKEYVEAHKVQIKADELQEAEMQKQELQFQGRLTVSEDKLCYKQQQELESLRLRIENGRDEHLRQRQLDMDKLVLRYNNVKQSLPLYPHALKP